MFRSHMVRGAALGLLVAVTALAPIRAQAQQGRCVDRLTEEELDARYEYIYEALEADEKKSKSWYFAWLTTHTGLFALSTLNAIYMKPGEFQKEYQAVGAVGNALGLVGTLAMPLPTVWAAGRLRDMPGDTLAQRRARLKRAEKYLERSAKVQTLNSEGRGTNFLWAIGSSLFLGLKYDRPWSAVANFFGAIIIGEIKIGTQPTTAKRAWDTYIHASRNCLAPIYRENRGVTAAIQAGVGNAGFHLSWF